MGVSRPLAGAVDACVAALGRQQLAREHGVIVLSVLADDDARQGWRQYLAGSRRGEVVGAPGQDDVDAMLLAWLGATDPAAIVDAGRAAAAAAAAVPVGALTAHFAFRGERQRDEWIADWALTPALRLAAWICQGAADGERRPVTEAPLPRADVASAVGAWLGIEAPALAISGGDVAAAARTAAALAHVLPTTPIALSVRPAALAAYLAQAAESSSKAMVRQGLVGRVDTDEADPVRAMGRNPIAATLAAPATPTSAGDAAMFADDPYRRSRGATDPDEPGRSAAERLLRAALDADDRARGRFAPCATVAVDFGGRPAEIDLLDGDARIAVEVDGHFHFRDAEAWRRDRRKDVLLQRHGYLVMRFLADDVVTRPDDIVAAIAEIVVDRRGRGGTT